MMTVTHGEVGQNAPLCRCGSPGGWIVTATMDVFPRRHRTIKVTPCERHLHAAMVVGRDFTARCARRGRRAAVEVRPLSRAA